MRLRPKILTTLFSLCLLFSTLPASAQGKRQEESKTFRVLGAVAGTIGGLAVVGLAMDDDDNTTNEFLTAVILVPAAGGIAGYFIGRSIDRGKNPKTTKPDPLARSVIRDDLLGQERETIEQIASWAALHAKSPDQRDSAGRHSGTR